MWHRPVRAAPAPRTFRSMRRYLELTRTHTYSLLFALPLLVLYEAGALLITERRFGMRNAADVILRELLAVAGVRGTAAFAAVLVAVGAVFVVLERRRWRVPVHGRFFGMMLAESVAYALLLGAVVGTATVLLLGDLVRLAADGTGMAALPLADGIVLSLGAGFYEELLFRVMLVGGLLALFGWLGMRRRAAAVAAVVVGALLFSAFHYVGPYGDPLRLGSFTFRFLAGLALSGLYVLRGFGLTAWTHALYNVFLLLAGLR
jgi:hypothetical protein